jgi:hypothetical protein
MSTTDYTAIAARFHALPDDAIVPDLAAAMLLGISYWTLRKHNPVPPIRIVTNRLGRRVGDIRMLVRGGATAK